MRKLHRSRDAIVRALKALRTHGFIDWLRRFVPTGNEGQGPKYHQTSNAYRLSMPQRALKLLGRYGQAAPVSDDLEQAEEQKKAFYKEMVASLSNEEKALHEISDPALAATLARLIRWQKALKLQTHPHALQIAKKQQRGKSVFPRN